MNPLVFLGGAAVGAGALLGASLWDKKRTEAAYSPSLKAPGSLDAAGAAKQLNSYFFTAQALCFKCDEIVLEGAELISTPIELPDDGLFQKAANWLGGGANLYLRKWRESQLRSLKEEVFALYGRYRGVFRRANGILAAKEMEGEDLSAIVYSKNPSRIDSSLENDKWDLEFQALADSIREFIENSCQIAGRLIDKLEELTLKKKSTEKST